MGKVLEKIVESSIPNAPKIACIISADHLLVSSVSNWGGYALAAAAAIVNIAMQRITNPPQDLKNSSSIQTLLNVPFTSDEIYQIVEKILPTDTEEINKVQRMIDVGARDGVTAEAALKVDGFDLSVSLDVIDDLKNIAYY
jgi:hypothetical protein